MSKIGSIFEEVDPVDVVYNAMIEKNPALAKFGKKAFRIIKVIPATGSRNTEARVVGLGDAGMEGIMSVFYDRASLAKVGNSTMNQAKKPTITLAQAAGTVVTLSTVMPMINKLFGFNLNTDLNTWPDVSAANITVPARGQKVTMTLSAVASANAGYTPVSLRTLPGTTLAIDFVNRGQAIGAVAVDRAINPFVKADGNINWSAETISANPANVKKSLLLKIINVDFSDLVNEVPEASNIYYGGLGGGNRYQKWPIRQALAEGIKKRCQELDIPIIDFTVAYQSGMSPELWSQLPDHKARFLRTVFRAQSDIAGQPWANPKFQKCLLTVSSFQNVYGFAVSGYYEPQTARVEAKEGWATNLANYPINYNLV